MGTGGLATLSCPHGFAYGWKFLVGGAESVRDPKDMMMSLKCWQPLTIMDCPCGFTSHVEASEPSTAQRLWGRCRGCWRKFGWQRDEMDLTPISIPEYDARARATRLAEIADDPATAALLASGGELLLERHPLMRPRKKPSAESAGSAASAAAAAGSASGSGGGSDGSGGGSDGEPLTECGECEDQEEDGRLVMCDCFHQGMGSIHHKSDQCQQHNIRMCPQLNDIPTTFMESINKVDRLQLRSVCVQDPGVLSAFPEQHAFHEQHRSHGCVASMIRGAARTSHMGALHP